MILKMDNLYKTMKCLINSHIIVDDEYIPVDKIANEKELDEIMKTFPDYYNSHKYNELVYLSTLKGVIMAPKTKGSKQLRLSSNILPEADMTGSIIFPNMTDEDYEAFLIGDDTTKATIDVLNKFGGKYGVKGLGGQLPQDIVMDLAKSQQFITDMGFILGNENKE